MVVGVPREVKADEYRVGMLPVGVDMLTQAGHRVLVQQDAGLGAGYGNDAYAQAGAEIVPDAAGVWTRADLIVKVKEPQPDEWPLMREGQVVFTYFHFAADRDLTLACLERRIVAVAYETLEQPGPDGRPSLPLLVPMSEIAGKMATQEGAKYLERPQGGRGVLLGGVPGVEPGKVLILGGGVVGTAAARVAAGMGADVVITDINLDRLRHLDEVMPPNVRTVFSDPHATRHLLAWADLVIGAVLVPGARAPRLVYRDDLRLMKPGAVVVDVSIDQGGCVETSRVTTHARPTYIVDGVVHYCVGNMPGAVARTSTQALTNATTPWVLRLAETGYEALARRDPGFRAAINADRGRLLSAPVAEAHGLKADDPR